MDHDQLAFKLKEFYLLEQYQVSYYEDQLSALADEHLRYAHEQMVERERQHVRFFEEKLAERRMETPSTAGDLSRFAGFVSAKALNLTSLAGRLRTGVAIEAKATAMYRELIERLTGDDDKLAEQLWHNLIDEEFHMCWFASKLESISGERVETNV